MPLILSRTIRTTPHLEGTDIAIVLGCEIAKRFAFVHLAGGVQHLTVRADVKARRRSQRKSQVIVEHVNVAAGGQAIVGNVEAPAGGVSPQSKDQPYAKQIAHAPQPAMWSADKEEIRPLTGQSPNRIERTEEILLHPQS